MSAPRIITTRQFYRALVAADVIRADETIRRIVIDAEADHVVVLYVERIGNERLLKVAQTLEGIEISSVPVAAHEPQMEDPPDTSWLETEKTGPM